MAESAGARRAGSGVGSGVGRGLVAACLAASLMPLNSTMIAVAVPGIAAVAAFAVRSELHGEIPVAAVEAREGATIDAAAVTAQARAALGVRAPRRVIVVERLPRNAAGKVLIRELEPLFAPRR